MDPQTRPAGPSLIDLHVGFVLAGMVTTVLGPLLPVLAARWAIPDAVVGTVFAAQFVTSTTVTMLSSSLVLRFSATRVMAAGFTVMALGVALLGVSAWPWALLATACYGCGLGLVLPTTNVLVAAASPDRESEAVSLVNVSWSVGALTWPLVVGLLATASNVAMPTLVLAGLMLALAGRLVTVRAASRTAPPAADAPVTAAPPRPASAVSVTTSVVVIFGALFFLYSGTEAAIGGWIAEHVHRLDAAGRWWSLAPTCFYGAVATGRLLTPVMLGQWRERRVLSAGLLLAGLGCLALVLMPFANAALVAVALAGLGLGPIFPMTFAAMSQEVGMKHPRLVGPLFALTGVGSAVVPWTVGFSSTVAGSLRTALTIPFAGCVLLGVATFVRLRTTAAAPTA